MNSYEIKSLFIALNSAIFVLVLTGFGINKNYKEKMKELMPEQFNQKEPSLEEKINEQIDKAKEEASYSARLRPYYLGKQRALEWVKRELDKEDKND